MECEELAIQLGISEKTRFRGALDPSLLQNEIAACDVFVIPSRSETFGIVAAEALSVGRPVVATRCGGPEDIVTKETGLLVANDDVEGLSAGIAEVCRNLTRYDAERLSEYAQAKFGFDAVVSQLTAIYERISRHGESARRAALLI
jgi:glycosyltransferase involved in cell wall biosynthesis